MSLSICHRTASSLAEAIGPAPGAEPEWRSLRLDLPETAISITVSVAPGDYALIAIHLPPLAGGSDPAPALFPMWLNPEITADLVRAADAGAQSAVAALAKRSEIRRLSTAFLATRENVHPVQQLYAQAIGSAIAAYILERVRKPACRRPVSPLPKWRLERVLRHIEDNLAERLSLAELANKSGLTRMYFANQFRASVGMSPHAYVLRRRIERAQEMLVGSNDTLVNVSLCVGFQNQAHFTTVFKRFVGDTPARWRQAQACHPARAPETRRLPRLPSKPHGADLAPHVAPYRNSA